jgi:hypothetical protein
MNAKQAIDRRIYAVTPSPPPSSGGWNPKQGDIYLFIYLVRPQFVQDAAELHYCTLLAAAPSRQAAEQIAINEVHQQGWHIMWTDTATRLAPDMLVEGDDIQRLEALRHYGVHFALS